MPKSLIAISATVVGLMGVVVLGGCGGGDPPCPAGQLCPKPGNDVTTIIVSPALDTVTIGATIVKTASARDVNNAVITPAPTIRFSSSAPAIATVDSITGVVTGVAVGPATITAKSGVITGTAAVVVIPSAAPASITITPANPTIQVSRSVTLTATAFNASAVPVVATFRWSSSSAAVATIDSVTGVVTGTAVGTATITVRTVPASVTQSTSVTVVAPTSQVAILPLVFLNTAYAAPSGTQIVVAAGGNLQTALNSANPGDEILLAPGATFTGNFTLPLKAAGGALVHIRTNIPYGTLPAEGSRMTPTIAAALNLAKIVTANGTSVFICATGASNYRFVGVEISETVAAPDLNALVRAGDPNQTTLTNVSTNLIFDRVYMHGSATQNLNRAIILSSANTSVIDSYISDVHYVGADAQALVGWNGPGPYKIVNNYLEASGENVMFGGADPSVPQLVPSDIEIKHNHFNKPTAWKGGTPAWSIKNLFELKNARRVLIEGNIFSNNWQESQVGFVMNLKSVNQTGNGTPTSGCTWCVTKDVTVRYNYMTNAGAGISLNGTDPGYVDTTLRRIVIQDNIVDNLNIGIFNGAAVFMQMLNRASDIIVDHNTFVSTGAMANAVTFDLAPAVSALTFTNNIILKGSFGFKGSGAAEGTGTLTTFAPAAVFSKNAIIGATAASYPSGNFFPLTVAAVGFTNAAGLNYLLTAASPFRNAGTDSRDLGADITVVAAKIAGVIVP